MCKRISSLAVAASLLTAVVTHPVPAAAQKISFIRDTEIENTIRTFVTPVFRAAGLDASAIRVYIVNDPSINAYVAGGQNIFINTGLLMRIKHPGELIGVVAHETGHIAHGDLSRMHEVMGKASAEQVVAMVLGALAGVASGRGDVAAAVAAGGTRAAEETFFRYSRVQEGAADAAAMRFLDEAGESSRGFLEFMKSLAHEELLSPRFQDPYLLTHPLTSERIKAIEEHVATSPYSNVPFPPKYQEMTDRMRDKLEAFLQPPSVTLRRFPKTDTSLAARYARAIAYYRIPDLKKALPAIDALIAERPNDPYFWELKGQMLFENARAAEAVAPYEKAVHLLPEAPLLRLGLARVQLELNDPALLKPAIANLRMALSKEPESPTYWHFLAIAYGRDGDMGESSLAMAQEAYFRGDMRDARGQAERAKKLLPPHSAAALQADDIIETIKANSGKGNNGGRVD